MRKLRGRAGSSLRFDLDFVAWDGEGVTGCTDPVCGRYHCVPDLAPGQHIFTLLANNKGEYIESYDNRGLSTYSCLDFLAQDRGRVNNVWFGFSYDVNCILMDLPLLGATNSCSDLLKSGMTYFTDFRLSFMPGKIFVCTNTVEGVTFSSTDTMGFFQTSFIRTLEQWNIPVPDVIRTGKDARSDFIHWSPDAIREYNHAECVLLVEVMRAIREALRDANLPVTSWHGAGAIAAAWLRRERSIEWIVGDFLEIESRTAYHGGRQDTSFIGEARGVEHYDINSAYPAALCTLPDLTSLTWSPSTELGPWGLYHIRWRAKEQEASDAPAWYPYPWRARNGSILYPPEGEGWYHGIEVMAGAFLCDDLEIMEGWAPLEGEFKYPWREPIERDFAWRNTLKLDKTHPQHAANIPIKLALNSLYGKLAQGRARGEDNRPKWQCYYGAGYVTAWARAKLLEIMSLVGPDKVLTCSTDGIFMTQKLPEHFVGPGLGLWTLEESQVSMLSCGSGLYATFDADTEKTRIFRSRGMPGNMNYGYILRSWGCTTQIIMEGPDRDYNERQFFVGMAIAAAAPTAFGDSRGQWRGMVRQVRPVLHYGTGKRHPGRNMLRQPGWSTTFLEPVPIDITRGGISYPYFVGAFEESEWEAIDRIAHEEGDD